jgi:hypothetical protein
LRTTRGVSGLQVMCDIAIKDVILIEMISCS